MMTILIVPIVLMTAVLTYQVCHHVLGEHLHLGPPRFIAAIVATLSSLSLLHFGDGVVTVILLPYAALALALFSLWLLRWLIGSGFHKHARRFFDELADDKKHRTTEPPKDAKAKRSSPRNLAETLKRKE